LPSWLVFLLSGDVTEIEGARLLQKLQFFKVLVSCRGLLACRILFFVF
jgi:hypothetical protein